MHTEEIELSLYIVFDKTAGKSERLTGLGK
jgi:hypothetical protein